MVSRIYDISVNRLNGQPVSLQEYAGKVLLIVNTASACGLTLQYAGLEALQRKYAEKGFTVLGFPCNQFGAQEPGNAEEIAEFCSTKFDVSFPLFEKIEVNGPHTHPLYALLKSAKADAEGIADIKWNFAKFLIGKEGEVIARYAPQTTPETLVADIEKALG
ncbi:MAG: glutathione peroxidase [Pseudomonadota bacterium]